MTKKILINECLLCELVCSQYEVIENYKEKHSSYLGFGGWDEQLNHFIGTYNQAADLLGIEKKELVPHD